jgi:hypothetical protein
MSKFTEGQFVTTVAAHPFPNGTAKRLRCRVRWIEKDGRYTVQSCVPGLYDGARFTLTEAELEG